MDDLEIGTAGQSVDRGREMWARRLGWVLGTGPDDGHMQGLRLERVRWWLRGRLRGRGHRSYALRYERQNVKEFVAFENRERSGDLGVRLVRRRG